MNRYHLAAATVVVGAMAVLATRRAAAQDWQPPSRQMPAMPSAAQLQGGWQGSLGAWFLADAPLAQVSARGEGGFVRFSAGPRPVAAWTDRNGDGRCDMIELYRGGSRVVQLIDPDYDGQADVLRVYDAGGELAREQRL